MSQSAAERIKRVNDAVELKVPDRVPIFLVGHYMPAKIAGLSYRDAYYKQDDFLEACKKFIFEYEPDIYFQADAPVITPGPVHDIWGTVQMSWPGHGIDPNTSHQFWEGEYMKQDEYDHFLDDPSDFLFRVYTPRVFKNLEGLSMLPPLKVLAMGCYTGGFMAGCFAQPQVTAALEAMLKASKAGAEWGMKFFQFHKEMEQLGFCASSSAPALAPFDVISDMLRGMKGSMMDMFKVPDKLIAAQEKLYPMILGTAIEGAKATGISRVFIPLHRGADGFMSPKQFETFYWPHLKRLLLDLIDAGLTPMPFFEGVYDQRLEYLAELPKGKIIGWFDRSDMVRVKEVLKDTMCIMGGMPISKLQVGTPDSIKEHTKKLIDTVGKDGGYIMTASTVLDEAKPELVKVWVDFTKEYGVYR
ncbi:MAG: uroporphyrinogen decarboxylase family protein [Thermincola sp.]|jgi:uroporphyrinogen-III decarboxylase|nr:uroporphyrinogen decarboxylase family protein [Thermincola sp.]MDT3701518.1 uroporphyrinogen decarboxylase family protein [Thermincola sp.]